MKMVPLTHGKSALVDDSDFEQVSQFRWIAVRRKHVFYALRSFKRKGKKICILMHRMVMNCGLGEEVDHRNRNGLDNTRANLRLATHSQNMGNQQRRKDNKSGFKGVSYNRARGKWQAHIMIHKKSIYLGLFTTPEEAHAAYCAAAKEHFGEFARTQ